MMSATCAKASVRSRCADAALEKPAQRILAVDATVLQVAGAARAEDDRPVLGGVHQQQADVGVLAQRAEQPGMALLDLLERQAPRSSIR